MNGFSRVETDLIVRLAAYMVFFSLLAFWMVVAGAGFVAVVILLIAR